MKEKIPKILLDKEFFAFDHYWQVVTSLNKWTGLWPYSRSFRASLIMISYYLSVLGMIVALAVPLVVDSEVSRNIVLENVIAMIFFVTPLTKTTVAIIFHKKRKVFYKSVSNDFMEIIDKDEVAMVEQYAEASAKFIFVYAVFGSMCVILFQGLFFGKIVVLNLWNRSYPIKQLPLYVEYGIDYEKYYYLFMFHMLLASLTCYIYMISWDITYVMSTDHICALFKIVTLRLRTVSNMMKKVETGIISFEDANTDLYEHIITKIVKFHREILRKVEIIEDIYNIIWFFIILENTFGIGVGFVILITKLGNTFEVIRYISLLIAGTIHFYFVFSSGQKIIDHSISISYACYDCLWYALSKKNKTLIKIIMLRSSKNCLLTGASMVDLSLEEFCKLLKVGLSIFTVFGV